MHTFFPTLILKVDTATDCHLQYKPIGRCTTLNQLDYVHPTSSTCQSASMAEAPSPIPAIIKPEDKQSHHSHLCLSLAEGTFISSSQI
jgi:hypothetical protein